MQQQPLENNNMSILTDQFICRETFTCERRDEVSGIESKCKSAKNGGQPNVRGRLMQSDPACLRWSWGEGRARATPCQCLSSHSGYWRHQKYLVVQIISTIKGALYLTLPGDPSIQSRPYTYSTTVLHPDVQRWCSKINLQSPGWSQSGPAVLGGSPGQSCQVINIFLIKF